MTSFSSDGQVVSPHVSEGGAAASVQLDEIETTIREARDIEDWQRDALLSEVRSLDYFYRTHRQL